MSNTISPSSEQALEHLRTIRPNDGWSIQTVTNDDGGKTTTTNVRLLRRNVPIVDNTFLDVYYDSTQNVVVGVLTNDGSTCQVLVDGATGRPVKDVKIVSCRKYVVTTKTTRVKMVQKRTTNSSPAMSTQPSSLLDGLRPEDRVVDVETYIKYALIVVMIGTVVTVLSSSGGIVLFLLLPLLYLYGLSTCPSIGSFDAKKELKRVLRGYHLPDDDPNKPKGLFEEWTARITATVTTEVATFPGYEIDMMSLGGAAIWTTVIVPSVNLQCYWVGMNHKWYYIGGRELNPTTTTTSNVEFTRRRQQQQQQQRMRQD